MLNVPGPGVGQSTVQQGIQGVLCLDVRAAAAADWTASKPGSV